VVDLLDGPRRTVRSEGGSLSRHTRARALRHAISHPASKAGWLEVAREGRETADDRFHGSHRGPADPARDKR
jgi:hypothetical protein